MKTLILILITSTATVAQCFQDKQFQNDTTMAKPEYNFHIEERKQPTQPVVGEMAIVNNINVTVVFKWSDKIVADVDDEGNPVEYTSGFVMEILPQTIIWNKEPFYTIAQTQKEKQ